MRDAFEVKLSPAQLEELAAWLAFQLEEAETAKAPILQERRYWWDLYEQAKTRNRDEPWPGAADLTSYLGAEKVDALHARLMRTIFDEPIWIVEGWGDSAAKAPLVEEFHQWKAEETRLQTYADRVLLAALIDPMGILEVTEGTMRRPVRRTIYAKPVIDATTGEVVADADGQPLLERGPDGQYLEVTDPNEPSVLTVVETWERVRTGPKPRVVPYDQFFILPAHAQDEEEVWGYAKRFTRRLGELRDRQAQGIYRNVDQLGEEDETDGSQYGNTAEKVLWEVTFLYKFDDNPERWYSATLHAKQRLFLRLQYDDLGRSRFIRFVLFPKPHSLEGYSFIGHKLITVIEEHTAWRNMIADRAAISASAPITRLATSEWYPEEQPFGPGAVITVRDHREISRVDLGDVPPSLVERERAIVQAAERIAGISDIALGTTPGTNRTLGERQLVAGYSEVRMEEVIKRAQEAMEDWAQVNHAIWLRTLQELELRQEGLQAPKSVLIGLESRGLDLVGLGLDGGRITSQHLSGQFRFKPRGSVQTADLGQQRQDFVLWLQALPALIQALPILQGLLQRPEAARALLEHILRVFRVPDRQQILGGLNGLRARGLGSPVGLPGMAAPQAGSAADLVRLLGLPGPDLGGGEGTERPR